MTKILQGGGYHGVRELDPHKILMIPVTQSRRNRLCKEDQVNQNRLFQEGCMFEDHYDLEERQKYKDGG